MRFPPRSARAGASRLRLAFLARLLDFLSAGVVGATRRERVPEDRRGLDLDREGATRKALQVDRGDEVLALSCGGDLASPDRHGDRLEGVVLRVLQMDLKEPD